MMLPSLRPRRPPLRVLLVRAGVAMAAALSLAGCSTFSSLNSAARNLDAYELHALPAQTAARPSGRMLFVAEPSYTGATGSERIVVKPDPIQVAFLGDGRWVEPAPAHVRNLLSRSFANSGRLSMVTTNSVGPLPDYTLLTDIDSFEAQVLPKGGAPARVSVSLTLTIARDSDARFVASRRFTRTVDAAAIDAHAIVTAFDSAMTPLLHEATIWGLTVITGSAPGV